MEKCVLERLEMMRDFLSEIQSETYQMEQNCETYRKWAKEGVKDFTVADSVSYVLHTREIYSLGESVHFKGQDLIIGKITSWLKGQELYNEYQLISKENGLLPIMYNPKISGVSLKANVTAVEKTMVQVKIQQDENRENCKSCWLDYATVYSTPDGTGWYCMPEIGDKVRVVFPDKDENNVYVASSVHVGAAGGRTNPEEKSWKNKQNKEILFTPDSIIMRNNKGLVLEMSDQNGIKMSSNRATQHNTYTPLPQHHVRVTPDFKQNLPKALGAMPLIMNPTSKGASSALKALGSMPGLEQVMITKNKKSGKYQVSFKVRKLQMTTGSYLHSSQKQNKMNKNMEIQQFVKQVVSNFVKR